MAGCFFGVRDRPEGSASKTATTHDPITAIWGWPRRFRVGLPLDAVHQGPVAFAQLKADAPIEWSFSPLEEGEEIDAADRWKTRS